MGFPGGSLVKKVPTSAGDTADVGSIPRVRKMATHNNNTDTYIWTYIHLHTSDCLVTSESCSFVSDSLQPMDYTVHGILQVRILEWIAVPFSRGSSQPKD